VTKGQFGKGSRLQNRTPGQGGTTNAMLMFQQCCEPLEKRGGGSTPMVALRSTWSSDKSEYNCSKIASVFQLFRGRRRCLSNATASAWTLSRDHIARNRVQCSEDYSTLRMTARVIHKGIDPVTLVIRRRGADGWGSY